MRIYPTIPKDRQNLYEKVYLNHPDLKNDIPCICGYYGQACRNIDGVAKSTFCNGCTLFLFALSVETIYESLNKTENIKPDDLYNIDVRIIQNRLERKLIKVDTSFIKKIIEYIIIEY